MTRLPGLHLAEPQQTPLKGKAPPRVAPESSRAMKS
jgi:hypothetical protein